MLIKRVVEDSRCSLYLDASPYFYMGYGIYFYPFRIFRKKNHFRADIVHRTFLFVAKKSYVLVLFSTFILNLTLSKFKPFFCLLYRHIAVLIYISIIYDKFIYLDDFFCLFFLLQNLWSWNLKGATVITHIHIFTLPFATLLTWSIKFFYRYTTQHLRTIGKKAFLFHQIFKLSRLLLVMLKQDYGATHSQLCLYVDASLNCNMYSNSNVEYPLFFVYGYA